MKARLGWSNEPASPMPDDVRTVLERCLDEAQASFVDPFGPYDEWLDGVLADLNARVSADARYISAVEKERTCVRALGYASGDVAEVANSMAERANGVIDRFDAGVLSRSEMEAELHRLTTAERTLADQVIPCVAVRLDVERTIAGEVQSEALERQGPAIEELVQDLRSRLHALGLDDQSCVLTGLTGVLPWPVCSPPERPSCDLVDGGVAGAVTLSTLPTLTVQPIYWSVVRRDFTRVNRNLDRHPPDPSSESPCHEQLIDSLNRAVVELEAVEIDQQHVVVIVDEQTKLWSVYGPFDGPLEALRFEDRLLIETKRDLGGIIDSAVVPLQRTGVAPAARSSSCWSARSWFGGRGFFMRGV